MEPYAHQQQVLDKLDVLLRDPASPPDYLITGSTGCGKTLLALSFPKPILIVTKTSIVSHVYKIATSIPDNAQCTPSHSAQLPVRIIASLAAIEAPTANVYIISETGFRRSRSRSLQCLISTLVIDEIHQFSGPVAIQNVKLAQVCRRVGITATPIHTAAHKLLRPHSITHCEWRPSITPQQYVENWPMPGPVQIMYEAFVASIPSKSGLYLHRDFTTTWKQLSLSKVPRIIQCLTHYYQYQRIAVYSMFACTVTAIQKQWQMAGGPMHTIGTTINQSDRVSVFNAMTHGNGIDLDTYDMIVLVDIPQTRSKRAQVLGRLVRACTTTTTRKTFVMIVYDHTFEEVFLQTVPECCAGL